MGSQEGPRRRGADPLAALLTMMKYELLANFRRKKFLGLFGIAIFISAIFWTPQVAPLAGIGHNAPYADALTSPHYDVLLSGSFFLPFFTLVVAMDSITGEFESRTMETLLTKPVSRAMVFFGKFLGGFLSLLGAVAVLLASEMIFSTIFYGPQNNLYLLVYYFAGTSLGALVYLSMVFLIAAVTKKTLFAVLGVLGYVLLEQVLEPVIGQYIPSYGIGLSAPDIGTGSTALGPLLAYYAQSPGISVALTSCSGPCAALSVLVLQAVAVGLMYTLAFLGLGYYSFRRAEIK